MKVRFADCLFDLDARRLFRDGEEKHLSPKAFDMLRILIEHQGRALSKSELVQQVWAGVFVSDASLAQVVTEIREAVGDDARKARIVRTIHRYGYAFGASLEHAEPDMAPADGGRPRCWLVWRKRAFPLGEGEHIVGREPGVSVWLDSRRVSRHHARLIVRGDTVTIEDLGSKNGTKVRGTLLESPVVLQSGDEIGVGAFTLSFRRAGPQPSTEADTRPA